MDAASSRRKRYLDWVRIALDLAVPVVVIGIAVVLLYQLSLNWQEENSLNRVAAELSALDAYLDGSKPPPSKTAAAQELFPASVRDYKLDPQGTHGCEQTASGQVCSATFVSGSSQISVVARPLPAGYPESVNSAIPCGGLVGTQRLHKGKTTAYLYHVCPSAESSRWFGLVGVTWANGEWLFTARGSFEELRFFLSDYPY